MESGKKRTREHKKSNNGTGVFQGDMGKFSERITGIRKQCGLTQEEVALSLGVSNSTISRLERGEYMPTRYLLRALFQLYGVSPEDSLSMLLDGDDHYEDDLFNKLRHAVREADYDTLRDQLAWVDVKKIEKKGMYRQLYLYAQVLTEPELDVHTAIDRLIAALSITKRDFGIEKIPGYRLRFDELTIINEIGRRYCNAKEFGKAATVFRNAAESMDRYYLSERLKCEMYPDFLLNLSTCYGKLGQYKEAEQICQDAKALTVQYGEFDSLPRLLNNISMAKLRQGDREGCLKMTVQAYFTALAMEKQEFAEQIKIDAERDLGSDLCIIDTLLLALAETNR
ncbi:MAG: helix-turn-helix transcriptional regulator [Oscillospiraceae bacterium]|jgi:transcriptional regulator with XRE-family HTH domain|nr:helix-turn-helix transcriptional regulator [Oscillospiraceae bacterium]